MRHKWWYLSSMRSAWRSVWVYEEVGLSPGCDEDWYLALIIQSIRFLGLLISTKVVWSYKFQNGSPHYSHPRTGFCDMLDSTELHRSQALVLVFGSYILQDCLHFIRKCSKAIFVVLGRLCKHRALEVSGNGCSFPFAYALPSSDCGRGFASLSCFSVSVTMF